MKLGHGYLAVGLVAVVIGGAACGADDDTGPPLFGAAARGGSAATGGTGGSSGVGGGSGSAASGGAGGASGSAGSSGAGGAGGTAGAGAGGSGGAGGAGGEGGDGGGAPDGGGEPDASIADDPCDTALFCETFEDYAVGSVPSGSWEERGGNGEVSVVDDRKYSGAKAVRFTVEAGDGGKGAFIHLEDDDVFPVAGNNYFGRMMFWLESAPDESVHWTFIQSGGLVEGETYHALYRYGGQHPVVDGDAFVGTQLMANYETPDSYGGNGPASDCWLHAQEKIAPVGRWVCAEWQFDGPNNTMRFWLDGEALDDLTMTGLGEGCVAQDADFEWTAPVFDNLDVGWESYQADDERTLFVDELILDTARVGCPD